MATKYKLIKRAKPGVANDPNPKYYAVAVTTGEDDFKSMTRAVADRCTVTGSDSKAVLDAFMTVMLQRLANGQIVRLNDLGSFRVSISSKGVEDEKKFNAATQITKARIIFTPCKELKDMCKSLNYQKVGASETTSSEGGGSEGGGGDIIDPTA